jgi:hypothetical protein
MAPDSNSPFLIIHCPSPANVSAAMSNAILAPKFCRRQIPQLSAINANTPPAREMGTANWLLLR